MPFGFVSLSGSLAHRELDLRTPQTAFYESPRSHSQEFLSLFQEHRAHSRGSVSVLPRSRPGSSTHWTTLQTRNTTAHTDGQINDTSTTGYALEALLRKLYVVFFLFSISSSSQFSLIKSLFKNFFYRTRIFNRCLFNSTS